MAKTQKKTVKDSNITHVDTINKPEVENESTLSFSTPEISCDNIDSECKEGFTYVKLKPTTNSLSDINIMELLSLEQACALLCKRYETTAQLDFNNNAKFKEFKEYYEMIFRELEKRVVDTCKK